MKTYIPAFASVTALMACLGGCEAQRANVVDLNKVVDALVAVLDEGKRPKDLAGIEGEEVRGTEDSGDSGVSSAGVDTDFSSGSEPPTAASPSAPTVTTKAVTAQAGTAGGHGSANAVQSVTLEPIDPEKQDPTKEAEFLKKYAAKLNELKAMNGPLGVSMSAGGEIVGFHDPNQNMVQDMGEAKEFTVTIDAANNRLVASDNHGYHRPHGYGFSPGGMMMGYMLGSMMGRQNSFYSGAMASRKPGFSNTQMSPPNYRSPAVNSVRTTRTTSTPAARARTGSKGFSFGK